MEYLTYGATQSNWLANIDADDMIFLSQFNYKSQQLFGPFRVSKSLFYNKSVIYPSQRYFYRLQLRPIGSIQSVEETDLYLNGIQSKNVEFCYKLISLIQQNKHLHCITLTDEEGAAINDTFKNFGKSYPSKSPRILDGDIQDINREYIWQKNKLSRKQQFASESDLETYILLSLKIGMNVEYKALDEIVTKHSGLGLSDSKIYNQFIFGNAYPSDITIINDRSINVFELKKDKLAGNMVSQITKEIKKHLYFSLLSHRTDLNGKGKTFNFCLVCAYGGNEQVQNLLSKTYEAMDLKINCARKNNLIFLKYKAKDNALHISEI